MAYTRTLAQLRTSLLVRGQYERSSDITPSVVLEVLNDALIETYDVFVQRWADYYTQVGSPVITLVSGTAAYAVPGDFYKLRKVEILYSGLATDPNACWKTLYPLDLSGANRRAAANLVGKNYRYRLQGGATPLPEWRHGRPRNRSARHVEQEASTHRHRRRFFDGGIARAAARACGACRQAQRAVVR